MSVADRNGSLETNESTSPETSRDSENKPTDQSVGGASSGRDDSATTASDQTASSVLSSESSTCTATNNAPAPLNQFDFNNLFNLDNIPGLSVRRLIVVSIGLLPCM